MPPDGAAIGHDGGMSIPGLAPRGGFGGIVAVWVAAAVIAVVIGFVAPPDWRAAWMPVGLAGCIVLAFVVQFAYGHAEGFLRGVIMVCRDRHHAGERQWPLSPEQFVKRGDHAIAGWRLLKVVSNQSPNRIIGRDSSWPIVSPIPSTPSCASGSRRNSIRKRDRP